MSMPLGIEPMPFGNSRAESQRDSAPKPRVASGELPWEKRVVSANPNGVVARGWRWGATPLGLKTARSLTQGSLADSATRLLGWRTQSLWDCRTIGLSVVPYGTGLTRNILKASGCYGDMSLRNNDLARFCGASLGADPSGIGQECARPTSP